MRSFGSLFDIFWSFFFLGDDLCPLDGLSGPDAPDPRHDQPVTGARTKELRALLAKIPNMRYHPRDQPIPFLAPARKVSEFVIKMWLCKETGSDFLVQGVVVIRSITFRSDWSYFMNFRVMVL